MRGIHMKIWMEVNGDGFGVWDLRQGITLYDDDHGYDHDDDDWV